MTEPSAEAKRAALRMPMSCACTDEPLCEQHRWVARALAEKDAALEEAQREQAKLQQLINEKLPIYVNEIAALGAWAREARLELGKHSMALHVSQHNNATLFESCDQGACPRIRTLVARAPEGVIARLRKDSPMK